MTFDLENAKLESRRAALSLKATTKPTMPPRRKGKEDVPREVDDGRPTVADLQGENPFAQLAKKHWLKTSKKPTKVKVKPDIIKSEIWDVLEKENFAFKSLLVLENLQILERYLDTLLKW